MGHQLKTRIVLLLTFSITFFSGIAASVISSWISSKIIEIKDRTDTVLVNQIIINITTKEDIRKQINEILNKSGEDHKIDIVSNK